MAPYKRLKEPKHHPDIMSREKIKAVIETEQNLKYKAIIATIYSSGIRLEECVNLDVSDIDSSRMVIHVHRGKFMDYFKQAVAAEKIKYYGVLGEYTDKGKLNDLICQLYRKEWVVYIKPSFASPRAVLKYLGNYTHRIAKWCWIAKWGCIFFGFHYIFIYTKIEYSDNPQLRAEYFFL
jgi:integrase